jgi:nickel superoxide dismutase
MNAISLIKRLSPVAEVHAHCDVPCGIYDPIAAKIAAQTVQKMVMRIEALDPAAWDAASGNSFNRYIAVKEEHAQVVKDEIGMLWSDYFKLEHLAKYPDLHETVWNTLKLAGRCKQTVDLDASKQLVAAVDEVSAIFWATKGVEYSDPNAAVRFGS